MPALKTFSEAQIAKIRTHWKAKWDFLGEPDADKDEARHPEWYRNLFVRLPASDKVIAGSTRLVVGRKGAGKSATRVAARNANEEAGSQKRLFLWVSADEAFAEHVQNFQQLAAAGAGPVSAWYKAFASEILRSLAQTLAGRPLSSEATVLLRKWALKEGFAERDFIEKVADGALALFPVIGKKIPSADSLAKFSKEHADKLLRQKSISLYVDDFDNLYGPGNTLKTIPVVQAAIEAADRLGSRTTNAHVTLLMREDLWLLCRANWHYLDKLTGIVDLKWDDKELRDWIHKRMQSAASIALQLKFDDLALVGFDALWNVFFPPTVQLRDESESRGFGYVLRRTMYTPRDLQSYLIRVAQRAAEWPASQKEIEAAEADYARDRFQFLVNEFGSLCDGLAACMQSFSTTARMAMPAQDLFRHLKNLINTGVVKLHGSLAEAESELALARFLFRIGFLEVRYRDGERFEVRDAFRHPDHWQGLGKTDAVTWAVRSTFFHVLRSH